MCHLPVVRDGQASLEDVIEKVFDAIEMDDLGAVKVAIKHGFDPSLHLVL